MMQDRFRFRIWWKKEKCWVESMMLCNLGFLAMQNGTDIEDEGFDEKDLVIQQCTGLKIKGKLLYEGDIVYIKDRNVKLYVLWDKNNCEFTMRDITGEYGANILFGEDREIIGNIYENKELLEEQK